MNLVSFYHYSTEVAYYSPHMKGEIPGNRSFNIQLKVSSLVRPSLYCVLSPKRIEFMTRKKFKCELNAAEIRSIKPNTNYGMKFA